MKLPTLVGIKSTMANEGRSILPLSAILCIVLLLNSFSSIDASQISDRKLHIVYLGDVPSNVQGDLTASVAASHHDMLEYALGSHEAAEQHLAYSYGKSFNGFAAWLSPSEVQYISNMEGVISVLENKELKPMTTRSWDFMGFPQTVERNLPYENDIIIGVLDTGAWPESESFDDTRLGPVPSKWKGRCQTTIDFPACNKKLIGAIFYDLMKQVNSSLDFISPRDAEGHGSHTASTAAGNVVKNASVFGVAQGDARGGVPGARIAVYKVCWKSYEGICYQADILAAFDDAISDGVDIISVSLGGLPDDYFEYSISIGAFHAMKRGVLVSNAAGNAGPFHGTVTNTSPWSLTVAAATIDRQYITPLLLANNSYIEGISINTFSMEQPWYPLIYAGDAPNVSAGYTSEDSRMCQNSDSLDRNKVEGKIVLCDDTSMDAVLSAGGAGSITTNDFASSNPEAYLIPVTAISTADANKVKSYINSSSTPLALILRTITPNGGGPAPTVPYYSGRGPNIITPGILKPDITAPGENIMAAWSKVAPLSLDAGDERFPDFNFQSGTSMACPHATGAAAYVKSFHPDWSPAAIKSALMTTARPLDPTLYDNRFKELAYGAGHIDPVKAINPGLVYDADVDSYIDFLCSQGYNATTLRILTGDDSTCPYHINYNKIRGARQLNYPSMMFIAKPGKPYAAKFPRTVKNMGPPESIYKAIVKTPSGMKVTVKPDELSFSYANQELSYTVKVEGESLQKTNVTAASLTWNYGDYNVRSPIVVYCPFIPL